MLHSTVIVADSEIDSRNVLSQILQDVLGYKVVTTSQHQEIIDILYQPHETPPEAILMDVAAAPHLVEETFHHLQSRFPCLPVIAMTDYGNMKQASHALELGAIQYLSRPVAHQRLKVTLENSIRQYRLAQEVSRMRRQQATRNDLNAAPAQDARLHNFMERYPYQKGPILFCGEKGTGKESLARAYHHASHRDLSPFVTVNCAALAETQSWSILFGELKNAEVNSQLSNKLTGALGGTLYINAIDNLSIEAQRQLIYILQESNHQASFRRKGEGSGIRLMASTQIPVQSLKDSEDFSDELLEFFDQQCVELLPLRQSIDDIDSLAEFFTERFAVQENPMLQSITPEAIEMLKLHNWPENVLELERLIFRAVLTCEDTRLDVQHIIPYLPPLSASNDSDNKIQTVAIRSGRMPLTDAQGEVRRLRDLESDMIHFALDFYDGHISEVARKLGIGRSTLYRKLNELDIKVA